MQEIGKIVLLSDATIDLDHGRKFYDKLQMGVGDYFYDSLISDIESLYLYAGIHPRHGGYHYMLSHKFHSQFTMRSATMWLSWLRCWICEETLLGFTVS